MASVDDLWLVDFGEPFPAEPALHRPALVLGPPDTFGQDFPFVIVCPLTTTHRGLALHVEVEPSAATGLDETSYVQCELLRSINRRRLVHRLGAIHPDESRHVADVVRTLLNY
jgi:mRNA interferase MazF